MINITVQEAKNRILAGLNSCQKLFDNLQKAEICTKLLEDDELYNNVLKHTPYILEKFEKNPTIEKETENLIEVPQKYIKEFEQLKTKIAYNYVLLLLNLIMLISLFLK